jgi:AraC-like DNA-binding protein/mannose-6-phosphate isomerase-like protein (cupin superfamily)
VKRRSGAAPEDKARAERKPPGKPFPFARMFGKPDALDRLDLRFRWGDYGIRVLRCHLTVFQPGYVIPSHKHSEFEFHFIPKGKGKVILGDRPFDLQEGSFYLTGPDVIHQQESDVDDPMHELCLHCEMVPLAPAAGSDEDYGESLEKREAEQCLETLRTLPLEPSWDTCNAMGAFLDAYRIWEEQPPGFYSLMKQAIVQILLRTARVYAASGPGAAIPERDMSDHRFQLASQYILDNEGLPLSLEEVAERVNVSPRQLQRIFRSEGQTTFRDYVEDVRLSAICADLLRTDRAVEQIALDHGFLTPNYLFPVFKHKFGMTPAAYRRLHGVGSGASGHLPRKEVRL